MKIILFTTLGTVLTCVGPVYSREILPGPIEAEVLRIVDGDTLVVNALIWPGQHIEIKVRLADINAPELFRPSCLLERQRAGQARDFLLRHTGTSIRLRQVHLGKYAGRVIARVQTDAGADMSNLLLQAGLAHPWRDKTSWCEPG